MNKRLIRNRAVSGLGVSFSDVASLSRSRDVIRVRHAWRDDDDARVLDAVLRAVRAKAEATTTSTRKSVEVYGVDGSLWLVVNYEPAHEPASCDEDLEVAS